MGGPLVALPERQPEEESPQRPRLRLVKNDPEAAENQSLGNVTDLDAYRRQKAAQETEKQRLKARTGSTPGQTQSGGQPARDIPYRPGKQGQSRSWLRRHRRKLGIGGVLSTLLVSYGIFISAPGLQFIHLGQTLGKFSQNNSDSIADRSSDFFSNRRALKTGRLGESRVSAVGSKIVNSMETKLREIGIRPLETSNGRLSGMNVEPASNPEFGAGSIDDQRVEVERFLESKGIKAQVSIESRLEGRLRVEVDPRDTRTLRRLSGSMVEFIKGQGVWTQLTAMTRRIQANKFWNLPSLLHPIKRQTAKIPIEIDSRLALAAERFKARVPRLSARYEIAKISVKNAVSPRAQLIQGVLSFTGTACIFYNIADLIPLVNFAKVVAPSIIESTDKQALGDQLKAGDDIDLDQLGGESETFVDDKGRTIWEGKALNALAEGGAGSGEEIQTDYQQAFAGSSTAKTLKGYLGKFGANSFTCNPISQAVQALASVALVAFTGPGGITAKAATIARSAAVSGAAIALMTKIALDNFTPEEVTSFVGPQGGNLLAYGARAGANLDAIAMGGIELSNTESTTVFDDTQKQDQQQFRQKSLLAQIFDIEDHRSLAARTVRAVGYEPIKGTVKTLASIASPSKWGESLFGLIAPRAQAAEKPYNWEFPLYGIPSQVLDNPTYRDPYANAEIAVSYFKGQGGKSLINRAKTCFGAEISNASGIWDSTPVEAVTPTDSKYINAKCGNLSNEGWRRTVLFVFDTSIARLLDCSEGDAASCGQLGIRSSAGSGTPGTPDEIGDITNIYKDSTNVPCASGTRNVGVHDGYHNEQLVRIRLCAIPGFKSGSFESLSGNQWSVSGANGDALVNSRASANFLALFQKAKSEGVTLQALSTFRTMGHQQNLCADNAACSAGDYTTVAKPGTSNHQMGIAIDFSEPLTDAIETSDADYKWLSQNAEVLGILNYPVEAWHWSLTGN